MSNGKRFCLGVDEFMSLIETDNELKSHIGDECIKYGPDATLHFFRNTPVSLSANCKISYQTLEEKLSGFLRDEFRFIEGYENCCTENQLKRLLEKVFSELHAKAERYGSSRWSHSQLLDCWDKWFAPCLHNYYNRGEVTNEVYETYDFAASESMIMHTIEHLSLPPMQKQYVEYYLGLKGRIKVEFTAFEKEILMKAGENILLQESEMCKMFDDFRS